jgi:hypothetical protein
MNIPNPFKQSLTIGAKTEFEKKNALGDLWVEVIRNFREQPDSCDDGGNDKNFFSFTFKDIRVFAVHNEIGGLTIMLPEEY